MTKKEMFVAIRTLVADNEEMVAFIDREIELLDRKNSAPRKPTKTQMENTSFKADVLITLSEADEPLTVGGIIAATPSLEGLTNQRVTHLLTDLRKEGKVARTYIKKVAYFTLGSEDNVDA